MIILPEITKEIFDKLTGSGLFYLDADGNYQWHYHAKDFAEIIDSSIDTNIERLRTENADQFKKSRIELVHMITVLENENRNLKNAVIDLRASLRTCANSANGALKQYKDL